MRSSCDEEVGDAAALEHDGAPRDLSGMRGKDGGDADFAEQVATCLAALRPACFRAGAACLGVRAALRVGGGTELAEERRRRLRWLVSARLMSSK